MQPERLEARARLHAALGDPHRLGIIDALVLSDRPPHELASMLHLDSNLLAHHLAVLQQVGLVERVVSQGDKRRRYVRLIPGILPTLNYAVILQVSRVVFVCTENVARSQIAAALWNHVHPDVPASSGGTEPGRRVHPGAIRAATRHHVDLRHARPNPIPATGQTDLVITVCDMANETLGSTSLSTRLHWSVPDPVSSAQRGAFDVAADTLSERIHHLAPLVHSG